MPTISQAAEYYRKAVKDGKGDLHTGHCFIVEEEAQKRTENDGPKPKTRFQMETDDPEMYSAFNAEKDRIIAAAGNKSVALSIMHRAWQQLTNEMVRTLAEGETAAERPSLGDA